MKIIYFLGTFVKNASMPSWAQKRTVCVSNPTTRQGSILGVNDAQTGSMDVV